MRRIGFAAQVGLAAMASAASGQSDLAVAGDPYFGGSVTLTVSAPNDIGQPVLLAYGLDPLPLWSPTHCSKGTFFIGSFVSLVVPGVVGTNGRCDVAVSVPPEGPGLAGIPIALQAYVAGDVSLSNPATLPLDVPYYLPTDATILESPNPTNVGKFGDVSAVGDLNADGYPDVVVGAWFEDAAGVDRSGRAYVFWGPSLSSTSTLEPPEPKASGQFGLGVWTADVDADGVDDLLVGEGSGNPPPPGSKGKLHVYEGGRSFSASPSFDVSSLGEGLGYQLFGRTLSAADFDGDGLTDIAVGLPNVNDQGLQNAGRVDVYWGPTFTAVMSLSSPDADAEDYFGTDLAAGDVNGDGVADLIEGNGRETVGGVFGIGRVYLFLGPALAHFKTLENPLPSGANSRFGNAITTCDIDGDGAAEVITTDQRNHAYTFWSPAFDDYHLLTRPPDPTSGEAISVSFGYFVAAGDANGDGVADIIVADPFAGGAGRVYVALGPYASAFHVLQDKNVSEALEFGWGVQLSDLDGDGRLELLTGCDLATSSGVLGAGHLQISHGDS